MIRQNLDFNLLKPTLQGFHNEDKNEQTIVTASSQLQSNTETLAKINTLINDFMNGNISVKDAINTLVELGISYNITINNGVTTLNFEYNGKQYTVKTTENSVDKTIQGLQTGKYDLPDGTQTTSETPSTICRELYSPTLTTMFDTGFGTQTPTPDTDETTEVQGDKTEQDNNATNNIIPLDEISDFKTFVELLSSDSFNQNVDKQTAEKYLDKMLGFYKQELQATGKYSNEYLDAILECSKENIKIDSSNDDVNLQEYLNSCYENSTKLLQPTDLHYETEAFGVVLDRYDEIEADNLPYMLNMTTQNADIQVKFFNKMFKDLFKDKNLTPEGQERFCNKLFVLLGAKENEYKEISFTREDFEKFDKDGDGNWMAELYDLIQKEAPNVKVVTSEEVENAKTVDIDILFGEDTELDGKKLLEKLSELKTSEDAGCIKLATEIENALNKAYCYNNEDKEAFLNALILIYNKSNDPLNPDKKLLRKEEFINGNNKGVNLDKLIEMINNPQLTKISKIMSVNEEIEDFSQGSIGDCWLLVGIKALSATPNGAEILKEQIKWADDYSKVTIYFAGENKYVTVTLDEIIAAQDPKNNGGKRFSSGDIDVMVLELAMVKIMGGSIGDIEGDHSSTFWKKFLKNADIKSDRASGIDDLINKLGGIFGAGGRVDLDSSTVMKLLKEAYNKQKNGENIAMTFSFNDHRYGGSSYYCTTVDGEKVLLFNPDVSYLTTAGHAFAITEITANTVTFVNPWNTESRQYTVTWEEFANMHVAQIQSVKLNKPEKAKENEFSFRGEVYNINEILSKSNSSKPTFVELTGSTRKYSNAADSAIYNLEILMDSIKENLTGYDSDKIDKACETVLNYYKAAIKAGTIRSGSGSVGKNFSYYDAVNNKIVNCSDRSDMRSAWDHKDINSGEEIYKKSSKGNTGLYIGHDKESGGGDDNDKFYFFVDIQDLLNRLMALLR